MSKGTRREREAAEIYGRAGFATYRPATVTYGENDVFGLFDVIAISPLHDRVRGVQVKSNGARGIRDWCRHTSLWRQHGWATRYLVPYDNKGWRLIECDCKGTHTIYDGRENDQCMGEGLVEFLQGEQQ